jgi:hypothetical protein
MCLSFESPSDAPDPIGHTLFLSLSNHRGRLPRICLSTGNVALIRDLPVGTETSTRSRRQYTSAERRGYIEQRSHETQETLMDRQFLLRRDDFALQDSRVRKPWPSQYL